MERNPEAIFLSFSIDKLTQFGSRIQFCLSRLSYDQVWSRGTENENAVGNLVLHLCGNVRQWIGSGVAGNPDVRERDLEFAARGELQPDDLSKRLEEAVAEAVEVLRRVSPQRLLEQTVIQAYHLTVMEAIYHVVEHFAQHTGQIIFAAKQFTGEDLGFYKHLGKPAPAPDPTP